MITASKFLVSIVIPCYNAGHWVAAAIQSALDQTYSEIEVIVVDDGSTDNSRAIIHEFGERVNCITTSNRGPSAARNIGLHVARGHWIQFLDADDLLHPDKLSLSVRVCDRDPDINFVWAPHLCVDGNFSLTIFRSHAALVRDAVLSRDALDAAYAPCAGMFRTSFLTRVGDWNESLTRWVDLEYHARIAAQRPLYARLSVPLYFYRQHSGQRISDCNKNHSNVDHALRSLQLASKVLEGSQIPSTLWRSYLWTFYVLVARSSAAIGDKATFQELLRKAAELRGSRKFQFKCSVATTAANLIGLDLTASMMDRILNFRSAQLTNE